MSSLNKATLIGRLGRDPETRYTGAGKAVTNFSLATEETWKDNTGEKRKKTEWHRCVAWGELAEIIQQYVKKGHLIYVEGRIETRQWEDKEHIKRYSTEIVVNEMKMLGSKSDNSSSRPSESDGPSDEHANDTSSAGPEITDEDMPF